MKVLHQGKFSTFSGKLQSRLAVTQIGQYNPASKTLRLYDTFDLEVTYSTDADQTAPEIVVVNGLYREESDRIDIKVDAVDASGIQKVVVSYWQENGGAGTQIDSVELSFNPAAHKWLGSLAGDAQTSFFVQVMDRAGNVRSDINKGRYYSPARSSLPPITACNDNGGSCVFLPLVQR